MVAENLILQRPLFQFITAFNNFSLGKVVWEQYQKFAIPTIENATLALEKAIDVIPAFTPEEANSQKEFIQAVTANVKPLLSAIEAEQSADFAQFRNASVAFFYILDQIEKELTKAASQADSGRAAFHQLTRTRKNPAIRKYLK